MPCVVEKLPKPEYDGGRLFRRLSPSPANLAMARDWVANEGAADNRPQPWEAFQ